MNYTEEDYIHNGVEVYLTNGESCGYDPVDEKDVWLDSKGYHIDNGYHVYDYEADEVDRIVAYKLYHTEDDGYINVFDAESMNVEMMEEINV